MLLILLTAPLPAYTEDWEFTLAFPMIWAPDISGEIDIDGEQQEIDITFSDILDNLDFGFIGEIYAIRGNWEFAWRSMYLGTESKSTTEPIGLPGAPPLVGKHKVTSNVDLFTSDLIAGYRVSPHFRLYTGVRRNGTKAKIKIEPLESGAIEVSQRFTAADEELFDLLIGVEWTYRINKRWHTAVQFDFGIAGDNDTDRQLNIFANYQFNARHGLWFGYRHLEIGSTATVDGARVKNTFKQQGPTLGWAFTF